jgi:hypothetical protein
LRFSLTVLSISLRHSSGSAPLPVSDLKAVTVLAEAPPLSSDSFSEIAVNDWAGLISTGIELAPAAGIVLLAALAAWLFWRGIRRLLGGFGTRHQVVEDASRRDFRHERREPTLGPAAPQGSQSLDASEILMLKASIDALTRQVAELSRKLSAVDDARLTSATRPTPVVVSKEDPAAPAQPRAAGAGR